MPLTTTLADLLKPALRMAGITQRPGTTPSPDQYGELIPAVNRALQSANCNGHTIFATSIVQYPLVSGQKIYTIGPGGDFPSERPMFIKDANLVFPTTPQLRQRLKLLDSHEWSLIPMQDIGNSLPWALFYNPTYGPAGRGTIYLAFQPPEGYLLELYTWTLLGASFSAVTELVILPDGYDDFIVTTMAVKAALLSPGYSIAATNPQAMRELREEQRRATDAIITLNTKCPTLRSEAEFLGRGGAWWWPGMFAAGGSSGSNVNMTYFIVSGSCTGTDGTDGNVTFTLDQVPTFLALFNGIVQIPATSYTRSGAVITFLSPNIPTVGSVLCAFGTT